VAEVRRKFFTEIPRSRVMLTSQHWLSLRSRQGSPTTQRPPLYPRQYHLNEHHESRCERCYTVGAAKILLNCLTTCLRSIPGRAAMNSVLGASRVGERDSARPRGPRFSDPFRPRLGRTSGSDCLHHCWAFCELGRSPSSVHRWLTGSLLSTTRS